MKLEDFQRALKNAPLPAAVVDVVAFDANVRRVASLAAGKKVRVASKSRR